MTMIYNNEDADLAVLDGRTVGVVGYAMIARAIAQNLRDNRINVIVSGDLDEQSAAHEDGFTVATASNLTRQADILLLALPDETMTRIYMNEMSPHVRKGQMLILTSAYNIAFGFIEPPPFIDVGLISPRTIGDTLRTNFQQSTGAMSYVSVWQDATRQAWMTLLAVAKGMGALKSGAMEITMEQEAELSLFIQQAILPAVYHIMTKAAGLLINAGYPSDAVFTDLYLSGKFSDYMQQIARMGILQALQLTNLTGQYGTYSRLERFDELKLDRLLEVSLEDIRSGKFAREWTQEYSDGHPRLNKLLRQQEKISLWDLEQQTLDVTHAQDEENI
jgi:ketol-acid reductoisomerase